MTRPATFLLILVFALGLPETPKAQVAVHQGAPAQKPAISAIIPGSPLAALTGAGAPSSKAVEAGPSPFGTQTLGFAITNLISHETAATLGQFIAAVRKSTTLAPVWTWLASFADEPGRRQEALATARDLALIVLPAIALETLLRLGLSRPRAMLVRRAEKLPRSEAFSEGDARTDTNGTEANGREAGGTEAEGGSETKTSARQRRGSFLAWSHRLLLAALHLALRLIPILAFGLTTGALLGLGFAVSRDARLSVIGVSNAYLVCRIVIEVLRFLAPPWAEPLRLFRIRTEHALWLNSWVRVLLITGGLSYGIVSISEILGLPATGAMAVTRVLVLVIHVELTVMIWQSRKVVGGWIRGKGSAQGLLADWRRRVARVWHYLAIFYVLGLWVAWAGGVRDAFSVLLRGLLFFMAGILMGRIAWRGSELLLDRLFPDPSGREVRYPNLIRRARAYNPLIKTVIRFLIGIGVIGVILLGWGINILPWVLKNPFSRGLISALIAIMATLTVTALVWEAWVGVLDRRINALTTAGKTRHALRLRTLAPILKAAFGSVLMLVAGLICLSEIGVNAAPLLAGAGVLGIAIGFGSQKLVQDIITGLFLLMEDTMQVGDVVTLAGMSGTVERLSIRTIRLRGGDGSINIIPFSAVTTVTNQTRDFGYAQISIGVGYKEDIARVCTVLADIARTMRAEPTWGAMMRDDLQIFGLDQFGGNALIIAGQIRTGPGQHWSVRREFSQRVVQRFAEEGIEIPYNSNVSALVPDPDAFSTLIERLRPEDAKRSPNPPAADSASAAPR